MLVENRFNAITLWTLHPFTYMIEPRSFPEASPWTKAELEEWRRLYRDIFRLAKERGLDTFVVHWNIFVSEPFAKAHGVALQNFYPHYYVPGDTSEIVKRYLRESVTQTLEEYPDLDGFGVSHGEGMAGMTPLERQKWVDEVLIAGMLDAKRPVKLIHRVPFSSGTTSEPGVSRSVEEVTRAAIERLGTRFSGPIWVEMKFNWSHAHSTPKLVKVHGGPVGDTYFAPPPANYKVAWMARNEDFFALRWGVPDFVRDHLARNGSPSYVGGYFIGSECYIPAIDYITAVPDPVRGGTPSSGSGCCTRSGDGCYTTPRRRTRCSRRSSCVATAPARATCSARTRWPPPRSSGWGRSTTRAGTSRSTARASSPCRADPRSTSRSTSSSASR